MTGFGPMFFASFILFAVSRKKPLAPHAFDLSIFKPAVTLTSHDLR